MYPNYSSDHMVVVSDPLSPDSNHDFFSLKFYQKINRLLGNLTTDNNNQLTLRTSLPLANCEPLAGMRSVTCPNFTAFSLVFKTGTSQNLMMIHQVSKFSNGTNSYSLENFDGRNRLYVKSSGFEETPSASLTVGLGKNTSVTIQSPDALFSSHPNIAIGNQINLSKNWSLISQLSFLDNSSVLSLGAKFQPCGHMHAGIAVNMNPPWSTKTTSRSLLLKSVSSSLYFETHKGGVFGCIGTMGIHQSVPHNFSFGLTSKLNSILPRKVTSQDTGGVIEIPSPTIGLNYDLFLQKISTFVDFEFSALSAPTPTRTTGPISLKLRIGLSMNHQFQWPPALSCHLSATESE